MSTESRPYEYGRIISVNLRTLGDVLAEDTLAGATSLVVDDAADFDEDGGRLVVGGALYTYTAVDDETSTITLSGTLAADAFDGDPVHIYDPIYSATSTEKIAQVEVIGDDGNVDTLECLLSMHLADRLPEGVRGTRGEAVKVELDGDGDWVVVDFQSIGFVAEDDARETTGVFALQDSTTVETAALRHPVYLQQTPITHSEHVYWNGIYQPGSEWTRSGQVVVLNDPAMVVRADDELTVEYLWTNGEQADEPQVAYELVGSVAVTASEQPTGNVVLTLPAGTQEGDLLCLSAGHFTEPDVEYPPPSVNDDRFFDILSIGSVPTYKKGIMVAVGREDGSGSPVTVVLHDAAAWRHACLTVFRGIKIASRTVGITTAGGSGPFDTPPRGHGVIAVWSTFSGIVADRWYTPTEHPSWDEAGVGEDNKSNGGTFYTPSPADDVMDDSTIQFAGEAGGADGWGVVIFLGIK